MRVKGGAVTQRRHKKILKMVKGQWGTRSKLFRRGNEAMMKSYWYAYRDRRVRRREFRRLWITRINAAARLNGLSYSRFMHGLKMANVGIDRKALADIAVRDAAAFAALVTVASDALQNGGGSRKVVEIGVSRPGSVGKAADISPKEKKAKAKEEAPKAEEAPAPAVEAAVEETVAEPVLEEVAAEAEAPVEAPPAPAKEAKPKAAKKSKKDNLKKLEGVGPKIASVLADAGIETFAQVASASVEELDKIVRQDAGISIANPETWPEQAALAAEGKWDELKEMQDGLKGGRRS